jgi:3-keto-disaccharide hydrolase
MTRTARLHSRVSAGLWLAIGVLLLAPAAARQSKQYALDSATGLRLVNVAVEPEVLDGKRGVRVQIAPDMSRRMQTMAPDDQAKVETFALVDGLEFGNGTIQAEIAGVPAPDAGEGARGFVGLAFRVQPDLGTYDAFYLRPTNGRAEDQERRNHSAQYVSHPDWPWFRLRKETPSRYEAYVDLQPNAWTAIRIEVRGDHARLFVHGQPQPTLVVNDVKSGATATGGVALWIDGGTIAHFRNMVVTP